MAGDVGGEVSRVEWRERRRFYGWRLVLVGAVIIAIGGDGVSLPPIADVLVRDWRETTGDAVRVRDALLFLLTAKLLPSLLLPFVGWAVDRWGARRMVLWGLVGLGGGSILSVGAEITAAFHLSIAVLVVGGAVGSQLPVTAAVNNWFQRRRATAIAVVMLGAAAITSLQPAAGLLSNTPAGLLAAIGVALFVIAWPLSKLVVNRPEDRGERPDGIAEDAETRMPDYTWREALRSRALWLIIVGNASSAIIINAMIFLPQVMYYDRGFSAFEVGLALPVERVVSIPFMLVGGVLGDRAPIRRVIFGFTFLQSIALGIWAFSDTLPIFYLGAVLAGIGSGGATPLTIAIRGVYFGRRNFATITGISMLLTGIMSALAPVLIGMASDAATGAFTLALAMVAAVSAVGSIMFLMLGSPRLSPSQLSPAKWGDGTATDG